MVEVAVVVAFEVGQEARVEGRVAKVVVVRDRLLVVAVVMTLAVEVAAKAAVVVVATVVVEATAAALVAAVAFVAGRAEPLEGTVEMVAAASSVAAAP